MLRALFSRAFDLTSINSEGVTTEKKKNALNSLTLIDSLERERTFSFAHSLTFSTLSTSKPLFAAESPSLLALGWPQQQSRKREKTKRHRRSSLAHRRSPPPLFSSSSLLAAAPDAAPALWRRPSAGGSFRWPSGGRVRCWREADADGGAGAGAKGETDNRGHRRRLFFFRRRLQSNHCRISSRCGT